MINSEILAVTAIFVCGLIIGFKIKEGVYNLREYISKRRQSKFN